ncbi:hypothetical protein BDZ45DRAFT_594523 [Acephala macrosclerotiorum]|nr:hypothetical protein BDZ45DRAFT_594523 [Acephala macrosclerotiorum]
MATKNKKRKGDGVRAIHSKSKGGCITCKIRRVKCDETKPHCLRCHKFKISCDGYDLPSSNNTRHPSKLRPLVPQRKTLIPAARPLLPVYKQPASNRFENEFEVRYFNSFRLEIAGHLGVCFDPDLWPRSFLQSSESSWPIRKGLIALGALDLTSQAGLSQIREGIKASNITDNYLFALQEYNRFILGMKKFMGTQNGDLRTQLLASILIICFESYSGNAKGVETQVRTSVRLLEAWKAEITRPWFHPLTSPAPNIVEDELVHFFHRLDLEVMSQGDPLIQEEHWLLEDKGNDLIATMPKEFGSLSEARMWGNVLHRRTVHWLNAHDDKGNADISIWDRVAGNLSPYTLSELQNHKDDFELWMRAFDPLFKRSLRPEGRAGFTIHAIMRAHWLVLMLMFESVFRKDEICYDAFYEDFAEMLGISRALLDAEGSNFTLRAHSIVILDMVAKKCRNSAMRREAIRLLADRPRREAFWDSVMAAKICAWIVEVEEEDMVDGYVPEEARVRKIGAKFDLERKEAELWCYQPKERGNIVDLKRRETTIPWATPSRSMPCYAGRGDGNKNSLTPIQCSRVSELAARGR